MPGNLPVELSRFVRRGRVVSEIRRLLSAAHAITLTGPDGMGKSRLALTCLNYAETGRDLAVFSIEEAYRRLGRIKVAVDPGDLFRSNHPVPASR